MTAIDYRHQDTAAAFLAERRFAYLADEPGLGKTKSVIMAADLLGIRRILVICPGAVRRVWEAEFEQWQAIDRPVFVEDGFLARPPARDGVTVVSHAALSDAAPSAKRPNRGRSVAHLFAGAPYDLIVVDEAHEARQFQAIRTRTLLGPDGLASRSTRTWLVSGTPVVNSAADLYPLVFGALRSPVSWQEFCTHYCEMRPDAFVGVKPVGIRNTVELAEGLRPHLLRRTIASLGIDLPPLDVRKAALAVDPVAVAQAMSGLDGWTLTRLAEALAENDDLRDAALARVRRALGLAKVDAVARHVAALGDGPVVAFFQHTDVRARLHEALTGAGMLCSWIDGTVTKPQLVAAKAWFQAGRLDALLVQTQAGGQGLTLHKSHHAVVAELPWTSVAVEQAVKRIHRIGQSKPCVADVLLAEGCWLDEVLATVVDRKRRAGDELLSLLTTSA